VSDPHIRILRQVAGQTQAQLDHHDTLDHAWDAASTDRREHLARAAKRTQGQVAGAEQRRHRSGNGHRVTPARKATP
jgi:hypothetical protein